MIDDEWSPDRIQLRALGHLFLASQNHPLLPALREGVLYDRVYEQTVETVRRPWLDELEQYGLIKVVEEHLRVGDRLGDHTDVCLTPSGIFYIVSHADLFAQNARTPTDDFPDAIVDAPWAIQQYYSASELGFAPASDRIIRFDDNLGKSELAIEALDRVYDALKSDNEIGSEEPLVRDDKLKELQAIRALLEQKEAWQSKLVMMAWGALGFIASHFADRPVAFLAEQAWHAIQALIGSN